MKEDQLRTLRGLYDATRRIGRELLVEIIASKHGPVADDTTARALAEIYAAGIKPDWWKLESQASSNAWTQVEKIIAANDPWCRGVVLLGLEAPESQLKAAFGIAAQSADRQRFRGRTDDFRRRGKGLACRPNG